MRGFGLVFAPHHIVVVVIVVTTPGHRLRTFKSVVAALLGSRVCTYLTRSWTSKSVPLHPVYAIDSRPIHILSMNIKTLCKTYIYTYMGVAHKVEGMPTAGHLQSHRRQYRETSWLHKDISFELLKTLSA
jgi:hypothetical protein